jgi:hypothetical protein
MKKCYREAWRRGVRNVLHTITGRKANWISVKKKETESLYLQCEQMVTASVLKENINFVLSCIVTTIHLRNVRDVSTNYRLNCVFECIKFGIIL